MLDVPRLWFALVAAPGSVTLHARDIEPIEVVRLYDVGLGRGNLVMAYAPSGALSGDLVETSWPAVLAWALDARGFATRERDGVTIVAPKGWPAPAHPLAGAARKPVEGHLVGEGVPVREAIDALAKRAGYRSVTGTDTLTGALALDIRSGTWGAALSAALEALCLEGNNVDGVLHVEPGCSGLKRDGLTPVDALVGDPDATELLSQSRPLAELRCAAIVVVDGEPRYAVLASSSARFVARRGTLVGKQLGIVDEIRADGVVVKEEPRDASGKRIPTLTTLTLAAAH